MEELLLPSLIDDRRLSCENRELRRLGEEQTCVGICARLSLLSAVVVTTSSAMDVDIDECTVEMDDSRFLKNPRKPDDDETSNSLFFVSSFSISFL